MSTDWNEQAARLDPENRLLWRMPRRRMEAEVLRDSLLAASGQLDTTMGGTLVATAPFENLTVTGVARKPDALSVVAAERLSARAPQCRLRLLPGVSTFPIRRFPTAIARRRRSPRQALFMMNGQIVERACDRLAEALLSDTSRTERDRIERACRRIFGRPAAPDECSEWASFLERYQAAASLAGESPRTTPTSCLAGSLPGLAVFQ